MRNFRVWGLRSSRVHYPGMSQAPWTRNWLSGKKYQLCHQEWTDLYLKGCPVQAQFKDKENILGKCLWIYVLVCVRSKMGPDRWVHDTRLFCGFHLVALQSKTKVEAALEYLHAWDFNPVCDAHIKHALARWLIHGMFPFPSLTILRQSYTKQLSEPHVWKLLACLTQFFRRGNGDQKHLSKLVSVSKIHREKRKPACYRAC